MLLHYIDHGNFWNATYALDFSPLFHSEVNFQYINGKVREGSIVVVIVVVVVNFIKHQNRAITGERVAARAAPSYQYAMVLVIIT